MKVIYKADDGTLFETLDKCYDYEFILKFPEILKITFFDKNGKSYHIDKNNLFDDKWYNRAEAMIVHNDAELNGLHQIADDAGWPEFEEIPEPGFWIRKETDDYGFWEKEVNKWIDV